MDTLRCQPTKSPYHKKDFNVCTEAKSFDPLFMENVKDIADTMAEVMIVCGIHRCKAKASRCVVVKAFQFYDIKRHRYENSDSLRGICRSDMVNDLERLCSMTRIEALLAYCIVKRALKAFYHGTPERSIRNPSMYAVILKEQEFIWAHAARRTIMIFERYEQMFFEAQLNYASQIMKIYKDLHERLKSRADPVMLQDYHPRGCVRREVIGTRSPAKLEQEKPVCVENCNKSRQLKKYIENLPPKGYPLKNCLTLPSPCAVLCSKEHEVEDSLSDSPPTKKRRELKNVDLNLPRCFQCNCPKIVCDCDIERETGVLATDCSQGPFQCQWVRMNRSDNDDACIEHSEYHQCPVDCVPSESSNESDSTEYCECSAESNKDEDEHEEDNKVGDQEDLENVMPTNLPRKSNHRDCHIRKISRLPSPKCKNSTRNS